MKKFTANYTYTNPNFVIQNLVENTTQSENLSLLYVLKNILQRGFPTSLSKNLQRKFGKLHESEDFKTPFLFVSYETPKWSRTILGDNQNNYFPAKDFFERIIPQYFTNFTFVQSLMLPEAEINEIIGIYSERFINQRVDFFLPQASLIIEIDGDQHRTDAVTRANDIERDQHLHNNGFKVVRITTDELRINAFQTKIDEIINHLKRFERNLLQYSDAYEKIKTDSISEIEMQSKILPTAIIRFQILLIELLVNNYLNFEDKWRFNILVQEELGDFAKLAIEDFFIWFENLHKLKNKSDFKKPNYEIKIARNPEDISVTTQAINLDFSLFKRYTDENDHSPDTLFVRTDYFGAENYFKVSTSEPLNYKITDADKPILEFFLQNIFDKPNFRDGQYPIIENVLNRNDTIGLLPTGGGKSL